MFDKISKLQLIILSIILGLSLVVSAVTISSNLSKNEISVTGTANEIVKSDSAKWSLSYKTESPSKVGAYNELAKTTPVVKKFLLGKGIKENDIEMGYTSSYPVYKTNPANGYATQEVRAYNYEQTMNISTQDVELAKKLQLESQGLVQQGVNISSSNVEYYYSKMAEKKAELLSNATLDAKNRANGMLKPTHNRVGKMRSAKMGVFQITRPESNDVTDWGINDTSTIQKKITAVANVVFAIR